LQSLIDGYENAIGMTAWSNFEVHSICKIDMIL
jgi:hypothetical protein